MALLDEVERRAELAAKVAMLEERSVQGQKQLDRIEATLLAHAREEETMLQDINKSLVKFKETIETKITETITPVKEDIAKYKTTVGVTFTILSVLGAIVAFFKEQIFRLFS